MRFLGQSSAPNDVSGLVLFSIQAIGQTIYRRILRARSAMPVMCVLLCAQSALAQTPPAQISREQVADILTPFALKDQFPNVVRFNNGQTVNFEYTFDERLQERIARVYRQYKPDFACLVAMDPRTGKIVNLSSFIKGEEQLDNLPLRAAYPAASVFKLVTATAALDAQKMSLNTIIPYNGKSTTLYKRQVFNHRETKWTRRPNLVQAFARSVNPAFGRIGAEVLGEPLLREYAQRFGFDSAPLFDVSISESRLGLALDDQWELAEAGSGFTEAITLSPLHAAQMLTPLFNDGRMVSPYLVERIVDSQSEELYRAAPTTLTRQVINKESIEPIKELLTEVVRRGSATKSFSDRFRYRLYKGMEIGGKTGSLDGQSPKGRHDWFVGYASKGEDALVFASLVINKEKWTVRSSYLARQLIYHYFKGLEDQAAQALSEEAPVMGQ